jgi:hypothetical protein
MPIYYKSEQIGTRRADFLVEEKISVELKAIIQLEMFTLRRQSIILKHKTGNWPVN